MMRNFFILQILFLSLQLQANPILVPSQDSDWNRYIEFCKDKSYECFPEAYLHFLPTTSIDYDQFISEFDLDNKSFILHFKERFIKILKNEFLNLEQFDYLKMAANKYLKIKFDIEIKSTLDQIENLFIDLEPNHNENSEALIVFNQVFKRPQKNLPFLNKLKHIYVSHNKLQDKYPYQSGQCDQTQFNISSNEKIILIPYFEKPCHFSDAIDQQQEKILSHFQEHKNKYIWGLVALAAAVLIKQNDVVIEY